MKKLLYQAFLVGNKDKLNGEVDGIVKYILTWHPSLSGYSLPRDLVLCSAVNQVPKDGSFGSVLITVREVYEY